MATLTTPAVRPVEQSWGVDGRVDADQFVVVVCNAQTLISVDASRRRNPVHTSTWVEEESKPVKVPVMPHSRSTTCRQGGMRSCSRQYFRPVCL